MIERRLSGGPVPWLFGLLWADIGILAGLASILASGRFSAIKANLPAYFSVFAIFLMVAITIGITLSNQQDAHRRALKRPIANVCIGLYAVSLELQRFISTLQFVSHNDLNGRTVDLAALRAAADNVERAAAALAPSRVLDAVDINRVLQTGETTVADAHESFAAACQALDRKVYDHHERWAAALQLANGSLARIGKTIEALQARR